MSGTDNTYPEIRNIHNFIHKNKISITRSSATFLCEDLTPVLLKIGNANYTIHICDEYNDLRLNNPLLNFVLVFRELSMIDDSSDFLCWCRENDFDATNDKLLSYYKNSCIEMEEIRNCFPNNKIDYFISDLDFQLNSGAIRMLRE